MTTTCLGFRETAEKTVPAESAIWCLLDFFVATQCEIKHFSLDFDPPDSLIQTN